MEDEEKEEEEEKEVVEEKEEVDEKEEKEEEEEEKLVVLLVLQLKELWNTLTRAEPSLVVDPSAEVRAPEMSMSLGRSHRLALTMEKDARRREGMAEHPDTLPVAGVTVRMGEKTRVPRLWPLGRRALKGGCAQAPQSPRVSTTGGVAEAGPPLMEVV